MLTVFVGNRRNPLNDKGLQVEQPCRNAFRNLSITCGFVVDKAMAYSQINKLLNYSQLIFFAVMGTYSQVKWIKQCTMVHFFCESFSQ